MCWPSFPPTVPPAGAPFPPRGLVGSMPPLRRYYETLRRLAAHPPALRCLRPAGTIRAPAVRSVGTPGATSTASGLVSRGLVLLRDRAAVPPRDHRRDPSAAVRHVDGADGPQFDGPGRWLLATRPLSDSRPRPALHAGFWRDPGGRGCPADPLSRPKSPNLNAYAERFVRSMKEECLSRVVPLGEGHLRLLVGEYVEHYHRERNHQGLDNQLLQRPPPPVSLRRRSAAGASGRIAQFLPPGGRMSGRPIKRTLRGLGLHRRRPCRRCRAG